MSPSAAVLLSRNENLPSATEYRFMCTFKRQISTDTVSYASEGEIALRHGAIANGIFIAINWLYRINRVSVHMVQLQHQ